MSGKHWSMVAFIAAAAMGGVSYGASGGSPADGAAAEGLTVNLSWGHTSTKNTRFYVKLEGRQVRIGPYRIKGMEDGDLYTDGAWSTRAGGGDTDGISVELSYADTTVREIGDMQSIWGHLLAHSDPDTVRRIKDDPGYRPDRRRLTVEMNESGTRGFSLTVDQLQRQRVFWMPELDMFITAGEQPVSFEEHQAKLRQHGPGRVLDEVRAGAEATYEEYMGRWEDMGSASYRNPHAVGPGHIICVTWDSAIHKFGIDRGAGVWSDLGNPDWHRFRWDFGDLAGGRRTAWKGQRLHEGLPVITTVLEREEVRYEIEQFAYPLEGPPTERRGDIAMVLMQRVRATNLAGERRDMTVRASHQRHLAATAKLHVAPEEGAGAFCFEDRSANKVMFAVMGEGLSVRDVSPADGEAARQEGRERKERTSRIAVSFELEAGATQEFFVYLPSPPVAARDRGRLTGLSYEQARAQTLRFWSDYVVKGAQFCVPQEAVNELFRANLWHALRLPRRHGGDGPGVRIDLPYSNFAYDQTGSPWPVNQAIYVDYMIYDLRGYHDVSAEELAAMFGNNQQADGRVGGYANWGVYTPSMIYAAAKHYLLSQDRASFESLLPQTLKAWDWCVEQMNKASRRDGAQAGLVLAPLNDLSHDEQAWAFNQAYFFAGADMLGRALERMGHARAQECRRAAATMRDAVARGYGRASVLSPAVQLRDHTWMPYVPGDALRAGRLLNVWYPTDVDTGALHMSRLQALDPEGALTTYLLHDHEDNLYYRQWGMANEPVYNQQATAYLLRDDAKAAIRAFYSYMACAFSHSTFEPVEHRWGWGEYYGPPSTDGAWFELYRNMLIHERKGDVLMLLQATPRKWLEDGKVISVEGAPTYYGPLSMRVESRAAADRITADIRMPARGRPAVLLVRLRHPEGRAMKAATVNGGEWADFDVEKEWVRIAKPGRERYIIEVSY